jgi:Xaa-Pro aminopeptidase
MPDRFLSHRQELAATIGPDGVALIPAATETIRNHDVNHPFRQSSDFFHLTGFNEPEALAVIAPDHPRGEFILFVRPRDREQEIWTGYRVGTEGARTRFRADAAHELAEIDSVLPGLLAGREVLYYRFGHPQHDSRVQALLERARSYRDRSGKPMPTTVVDVGHLLAEQRLRKTDGEIDSLRAACELSAEGHREAMRFARPDLYEYQVQAAMEYVWREAGSPRNGYSSIVASGPNACVLHYEENDRRMEEGDLLLIDAACEIDYFSADITRTFPVGGHFSPQQRAVYEVVLTAQRRAIRACVPGATIREVHDAALMVITEGLVDLGLLPLGVEESLAMHHYREFFMHGTSHWLGLDVHDAGSYRVEGKPRMLEPRMAFTVEPGLYIDQREEIELPLFEYDQDEWQERILLEGAAARNQLKEKKDAAEKVRHRVPEALRGIGVRIEDDILIVDGGHENLTRRVPVDPDQIEDLCSEVSWLART